MHNENGCFIGSTRQNTCRTKQVQESWSIIWTTFSNRTKDKISPGKFQLNDYSTILATSSSINIHIFLFVPIVEWWDNFGQSTPNLQKFAVRILGLTYSASGCKHNWSVFEQVTFPLLKYIENENQNLLTHWRWNFLIFQLHSKKRK